ncbi:hypothetical protein AL546_005110 [Vibrio vulnificus]|nr:hypothetical protein AL546_005110 [Vibrio vulnificus]
MSHDFYFSFSFSLNNNHYYWSFIMFSSVLKKYKPSYYPWLLLAQVYTEKTRTKGVKAGMSMGSDIKMQMNF